jgi:hypothetical protein
MTFQRHRHATVAQMMEALNRLEPGDIICTEFPPSGNVPILRGENQIAVIEMAPMDLGLPDVQPSARLEMLPIEWTKEVTDA